MSAENAAAGGTYGTVDRQAGKGDNQGEASRAAAEVGPQPQTAIMSSASTTTPNEVPRKRKGDTEWRSEAFLPQSPDFEIDEDLSRSEESEDQQGKMKCFREPHRQIEKRRRDKMNNLIEELSAMFPSCNPSRKLDKLTVLRTAVQHLKALKVGTASAFTDSTCKPSFLPEEDLKHIVLRAADGFLLVVTCDRGKILFISESVSKTLNFNRLDLTGQSLFHFLHPKDISKVKEQLSASESPRERLVDAATGVKVKEDVPVGGSNLSTGARRSFFCRMKLSRGSGNPEDKRSLPVTSKKKESSRYCTVHCTGYMRSWPVSQLDEESDSEKEGSHLTCLVTVCRIHPSTSHQPPAELNVKPTEFVMRCAIDGKFTFVDQQATVIIGYLPQEVLGTSCYEYFHQDDLHHLAEKHRQVLRSKEKIETNCYKFKTKHGSYISLQKDSRRVLPVIPGLSTSVGKMIYTGSIGSQIASELIDSHRMSLSPSSGATSPFGLSQDKSPMVSAHDSSSMSGRQEGAGTTGTQSDLRTTALAGNKTSGELAEGSPLDLDVVAPSLASDDAAMAVIMSLLESETNMGQVDFEDIHWPL